MVIFSIDILLIVDQIFYRIIVTYRVDIEHDAGAHEKYAANAYKNIRYDFRLFFNE